MLKTIGIRREDKNEWERRVPLVPDDVAKLREKFGIKTIIQPSEIRVFKDDDYRSAGAEINEDIRSAQIVLAVKEIPFHLLEKEKTYLFFSHTIKGQPYNMEMLKRLMELRCNLIDYELIASKENGRLISFSRYAGIAGLIETLHAFGQKMKLKGFTTPFAELKQAYEYDTLEEARVHIEKIGRMISEQGLPKELAPLTVGFLGYGNVSKGAQEIFDLLPVKSILPGQLKQALKETGVDNKNLFKIVFKEQDLVRSSDGAAFNLQNYYDRPQEFESIFSNYLADINILINGVYWTESYPRFVTRQNLKDSVISTGHSGLQVIGDISCDINGSIEITRESTMPDKACYTYHAEKDSFVEGIDQTGTTVMAIDNLPCEFSRDASASFSEQLNGFMDATCSADFNKNFDDLNLPAEIKRAVILHKGHLTGKFEHMKQYI